MRCGSGGTPAGSLVDGKVIDVSAVGSALRQLLARTEIHETKALIAASDGVARRYERLGFVYLGTRQQLSQGRADSTDVHHLAVDERSRGSSAGPASQRPAYRAIDNSDQAPGEVDGET